MKNISRPQLTALGLVFLSQWTSAMVILSLSPLAPLFQRDLGLTKAQVGLLSSATSMGSWSTVLVNGMLTDRLGIRRVMSAGLMLTGSLMMLMSFVGSLPQAMAVLFVANLPRSTAFTGTTKAVLEWFSLSTRATAMGIKQLGMPISGIFVGLTLPAIGLAFGWRAGLVVVALLVLISGIVIAVAYREAASSAKAPTDAVGLRVALGDMLRNRSFVALSFMGLCLQVLQLSLLGYLPLYFQEVVLVQAIPEDSARIIAAGGYLAIVQFGGCLGRISWGVLSDRFLCDRRMIGMVAISGSAAVLSFVVGNLGEGEPLWLLTGIVIAYGMTAVGWNGLFNTILSETVGRKYAGTGVGLAMTVTEIGSILGPPFFGLVVDVTSSFQTAWYFLGAMSALGTVLGIVAARENKPAEVY